MRWPAYKQLVLSRLREFYREPEALFWVYVFPLLLALGLGIAFWDREPEPAPVDVAAGSDVPLADGGPTLRACLEQAELNVEVHGLEECRQRLRTGKTALFVTAEDGGFRLVYDRARADSLGAYHEADAAIVRGRVGSQAPAVTAVAVREPGSRYIDFLMPGLIGLSLLSGGLWGVGFTLVDLRVRKLLKRLLATPMHRPDFLLALLGSRLLLMLPEMVILLAAALLGFGVPLRGSPVGVVVVILLGALAFYGLGLLLACRTSKTETIAGLINLVMLPLWLLSGTFFSSKRYPDAAQPFIQALPLTQVNDALREIMLEGAPITAVAWRLGILAAWAVVTFVLALRWFRWE
jgi:ABC transporter DrrB family efflux protein